MSAWWNDTPGSDSTSLEVVISVCSQGGATCLIILVNHVFILVRTGRITLWMTILVSQTITRRHAIPYANRKKLVHAFDTDLKATGPAGQHNINCCGPTTSKCMRASGHIANVEPWYPIFYQFGFLCWL